ncbi:MAG: sigma 54-interacting transcriptional regulator [Planctomycetes bacterium]|nr:sigma 54-interacting transcriptional regulator [Planctomycetota bacterium]
MPCLRIIAGPDAGAVVELDGAVVTIGRDAGNAVRIGDVKSSRVHAEIACVDGQYRLTDLGSSNGTWRGEDRISSAPLADGYVFRIGKTQLRFESVLAGDDAAWVDPARLEGLGDQPSALLSVPAKSAAASGIARANAYLALLHQVVQKSHVASGRDELFELLDDVAADALEGDRCAVFLPAPAGDPAGWVLWPAHERRLRARYGAVPFARSLLGAVRRAPAALLCTRAGDLAPSASMVAAGVRSAMAAPLRIGGEVHALLYVDRISGEEPFTRADLEFLAAVANQLAVQLHNREHVAVLEAEVDRLQSRAPVAAIEVIAVDPGMAAVAAFLDKAAAASAPVLLRGEGGTGKLHLARAIHQRSARAAFPLQVVVCAALADAEAQLFGRSSGGVARPGLVELADGGTLVLDDVDALSPSAQAKLLGVLDGRGFSRDDGALRRIDARIFATTARDLSDDVRAGRFSADLLARLDVLTIAVPPLRERPADIDVLAERFLAEHARALSQPKKRLAPETRAVLLRHGWPGNVRQLRNALERACVLAAGDAIRVEDLPEAVRGAHAPATAAGPITTLAEVERGHIQRVLEHCGGNKKLAAEVLGIDRSTLYAKLKQYGA